MPTAPVTVKPWQSKVIVVNALAGLFLFVGMFVPQAHVINDFVVANPQGVAIFWSLANMLLRAIGSNVTLVD